MPASPGSFPSCAAPCADGLRLAVKLRPGARRAGFLGIVPAAPTPGWPSARLALAVSEPAEAGRANEAAIAALAAALAVRAEAVTLLAGRTARDKLFVIAGDAAALAVRLAPLVRNSRSPKA